MLLLSWQPTSEYLMLQIQLTIWFPQNQILIKKGFVQTTNPQGAYETENLDNELKRYIIKEGYFTEGDYPFKIKPNFSSLCSVKEISWQKPLISFIPDDSIRDISGFNAITKKTKNLTYHLPRSPYYRSIIFSSNAISDEVWYSKEKGVREFLTIQCPCHLETKTFKSFMDVLNGKRWIVKTSFQWLVLN